MLRQLPVVLLTVFVVAADAPAGDWPFIISRVFTKLSFRLHEGK